MDLSFFEQLYRNEVEPPVSKEEHVNFEESYKQFVGEISQFDKKTQVIELTRIRQKVLEFHYYNLLPHAAHRLNMQVEELHKRCEGIYPFTSEIKDINLINGWVDVKDGRFKITINMPLLLATWFIANIWVATDSIIEFIDCRKEGVRVPFSELIPIIYQFIDAFYEDRIDVVKGISLERLHRLQLNFSGQITFYMQRFIIAHELGHVVASFSQEKISSLIDCGRELASAAVSEILQLNPDWPCSFEREELEQRWAKELVADVIGIDLSALRMKNEKEFFFAFWATAIFFFTLELLEEFWIIKKGQLPPLCSHPLARYRIKQFCSIEGDRMSERLRISRALQKERMLILDRLQRYKPR